MQSYIDDLDAQKVLEGLVAKNVSFNQFSYMKGLLRYEGKIYVGKVGDIMKSIIWELHESPVGGHLGQEATY